MLLLLPSIWSPCSITGQDEYFLSFRTVFEMQERSQWLTPYVNGEVRLQKPPLLYWLMRCSFVLFGNNLFAARIWCVLAGAGFALFTAKLARRLSGPKQRDRGYLAGLLVVSAAGVMIDARRAMFDLPVACLSTAAIYYGVVWYRTARLRAALAMATSLAAATMCKGPVALWFFLAAILAAAATRRGRPAGSWWHCVFAALLFVALALPWPLWVQLHHPSFWQVLQTQAEQRQFAVPGISRVPQLLGALLGIAVPWSIAVIASCWAGVRKRGTANEPARWLITWLLIGLLPFAFMKTFERYLLALLCPMAMLAANWLAQLPAAALRQHLSIATVLAGIPVLVFALFAMWFGFSYTWPILSVAVVVLSWRSSRRNAPNPVLTASLCATMLCVLLGFIYPSLGINRLPSDLPDDLATSEVQTFGRPQPGMLSMHVGRSVQQMDARAEGLAERLRGFHGYLFVLEQDQNRVEQTAQLHGIAIERIGEFHSFYSRKAWLRFYRSGVTWADWQQALASRSPTRLQPRFVYYRLP